VSLPKAQKPIGPVNFELRIC